MGNKVFDSHVSERLMNQIRSKSLNLLITKHLHETIKFVA